MDNHGTLNSSELSANKVSVFGTVEDIKRHPVQLIMTENAFDKLIDETFYDTMTLGDTLIIRVRKDGNAEIGYVRKGVRQCVVLCCVTNAVAFGSSCVLSSQQRKLIEVLQLYGGQDNQTLQLIDVVGGNVKATREFLMSMNPELKIENVDNPYDFLRELEIRIERKV